jgi:ribosomal protein S18 acetylase RimI-like enzyme
MNDAGVPLVRVVPHDRVAAALNLVFSWEPEPERTQRVAACLAARDRASDEFTYLLEATRDGVCVGATWALPAPGRVVQVWPPSLMPDERVATADVLQSELDRRLQSTTYACAQALLPPDAKAGAACLLRHNYTLAAELLFLGWNSRAKSRPSPTSMEFEAYRPDQHTRLANLVDATYVETQDAPALNGMRSAADVLEGYRRTGTFSPDWWQFVRHADRDVGCLLLTDHPDVNIAELLYMGLIPSARGRGWGTAVVRQAQRLVQLARRAMLLLGVDSKNQPALAAYARCGFSEVGRRIAYCKPLASARDSANAC